MTSGLFTGMLCSCFRLWIDVVIIASTSIRH